MELTLDTKENCFLCLQTIPEAEKNELCLKNICRFLQIDISDVLLEGLKEGEVDIDAFNYDFLQSMKCNFSVTLCIPCYGVTEKLSAIIHDLEVAHLQVNYYSEVLQNILEKADLTSVATNKTDNSQTADARMVEHLRKKAKQKCFSRTRRVLASGRNPLVKLNRLTNETVTTRTRTCTASITPAYSLNDVGVDISLSNNSTVKYAPISSRVFVDAASPGRNDDRTADVKRLLRTKLITRKEIFFPPTVSRILNAETEIITDPQATQGNYTRAGKMNQILHDNVTKYCHKQDSSGTHCTCALCDEILWRASMKNHLTTRHPEKLLLFAKKAYVPEKAFEKLCRKVVQEACEQCETLSTYKSNGKLVKPSGLQIICYICNKIRSDSRHLRHHLVMEHADKLVEKLDNLQEKYCISPINSDPPSCPISADSYENTAPQLKSSEDHQIMSCSESLNPDLTMSDPVVEQVVLKEDWILCPNNPETKESQMLEDPLRCTDWEDDGIIVKTEICNDSFTIQQVIQEEGRIPKKRKIDSDETPNAGGLVNCVAAQKMTVNRTQPPKSSKGRFACSHCKRRFSQSVKLRMHMISFHPEQIFLSYKPVHKSASELVDSCRKIFQKETAGYGYTTRKAVPRQCAYCTKFHRYKQDYLNHLVYSHGKVIGEKIIAFENEVLHQIGFIGDTMSADASNDLPVGLIKTEICDESCRKYVELEGRKSSPLSVVEEKMRRNHSTKSFKGRLVCNHCKCRFANAHSLQNHMISHHPDQIFLCYKPVQRTESQFAYSCREIFEKVTVGYTNATKRTVPHKCAYCRKIHRYKQEYLRHVVYSHKNIIGEKIRAKSTNHVPNTSKGQFACSHCKRIFPRSNCLLLHMISHHPEQMFLGFKPVHLSESQFSDSCREILQRETVGYYNSHGKWKNEVPQQCAYCKEMRRYKREYLKHLVRSHTNIMGEKIKRFANGESQIGFGDALSGECNQQSPVLDGSIFKEGQMTINWWQKKNERSRFACSHCKKVFMSSYKLRLHMISIHPDQIFLAVKPAHRSGSQFANLCRKIFERETARYGNVTKKAVPQQCAYCTEMRWYKQDYLKHLVYSHTSIMREKIRAFEDEEAQVEFIGDTLTGDALNELQVEKKNETIDSGQATGESSQLDCAGNDNHSYPVVVRVEQVDQRILSPKYPYKEVLSGGDWNDVQVEGVMIKTDDYSEISSERVPILVDPLSIDELNNCTAINAITTPVDSCQPTDIKYFANNGFE